MTRVIINADDFGLSAEVNSAIEEAFRRRLISSTTLLTNMPGFADAVARMNSGAIPERAVGVHLNLFNGTPLTEGIRSCPVFCADGVFHSRHVKRSAPAAYLHVIAAELRAQIRKALDAGVKPTHLDSHARRHTNWYVGKVVLQLAKEFGIPFIREASELRTPGEGWKLRNRLYNWRLGKFRKTDHFGSIPKVAAHWPLTGLTEIMCHPVWNADRQLVDAEYPTDLAELLASFLAHPLQSFAGK